MQKSVLSRPVYHPTSAENSYHPVQPVIQRRVKPDTSDIAPTLPNKSVRKVQYQPPPPKPLPAVSPQPVYPSTQTLAAAAPLDRTAEQFAQDVAFIASRRPKAQPAPKYSQSKFPAQPLTTSFFRPATSGKAREHALPVVRYNIDAVRQTSKQHQNNHTTNIVLPSPTRDELPNAAEMHQYKSERDYGVMPSTQHTPKVIELDVDKLHEQPATAAASDHLFHDEGFFSELMSKLEVTNAKLQIVLDEVHKHTPKKVQPQQQQQRVYKHDDIIDSVITHNITPRIERTVSMVNQISTPSHTNVTVNAAHDESFTTNKFQAEEVESSDNNWFDPVAETAHVELDMSIHSTLEHHYHASRYATPAVDDVATTASADHAALLDDNNLNIDDESWSTRKEAKQRTDADQQQNRTDIVDAYDMHSSAPADSAIKQTAVISQGHTVPTTATQRPLVDNRHDTDAYNFSDITTSASAADAPVSRPTTAASSISSAAQTLRQQLDDEVWQSIADKITIPIVRNDIAS